MANETLIARLEHFNLALGSLDNSLRAMLLNEEVRGAPNVDFFHGG